MHIIEVIDFYKSGIKPSEITHTFTQTITVPYKSKILAEIDGKEVEVRFPRDPIEVPDWLAEKFEQNWIEVKNSNPKITNRVIANLKKFDVIRKQWQENLTDFKTLSGLRAGILAELEEELQDKLLTKFAPTGIGAVVETSDEKLILGIRGKIHLEGKIMPFPAGHPEYTQNNLENPLQALTREAIEEMNLPLSSEEYEELYLIGMVRDRGTTFDPKGSWNPLATFYVKTKLDSASLSKTCLSATDKYEHLRILISQSDEKILSKIIEELYPKFVGNGLGELLLYGRFKFGEKWYEGCKTKLCRKYKARIREGNPFSDPYE